MELFEIDKSHCNSIEQRLLWNIQELLRLQNDQSKETDNKCTLCGGVHLNNGERLACARTKKRKGV